ncbi:MAG: bacteriorhodopsin [Hyphomicrobiaceae bacterium]
MPGMNFLSSDLVSTSYAVATVAMLASAALILLGMTWTSDRWRLPVALVGVALLASGLVYVAAAETWATSAKVSAASRYVGWFIVQPLQVASAYFFARISGKVPVGVFWRTIVAALLMVLCRFLGDARIFDPTLGVLLSIAFWLYILGELYFGAMSTAVQNVSRPIRLGYFWIRLIMTIGWAALPILHFVDVVIGAGHTPAIVVLYNIADVVNLLTPSLITLAVAGIERY